MFERPRVACRLEFCTVTIAFKVSRLVARSVTKELVKDNMGNHGKVREKIVHYLRSSCCNSDELITTFSRLASARHYSEVVV